MNKNTEKGIAIGVLIGAAGALIVSSKKVRNTVRRTARRIGKDTGSATEKVKEKAAKTKDLAVKKPAASKKTAAGTTRSNSKKT